MSPFDPVDIYCERTSTLFWDEPLNAITNLSFILAAWFLAKLYKERSLHDREIKSLIGCVGLVGIGSFTFHTFANFISQFADVFPIVMLVVYYIFVSVRKLFAWSWIKAFAAIVLFLVVAVQMESIPKDYSFNGSIAYFPCLAVILLIGARLKMLNHPAYRLFFKAGGLFMISLTFRSIDMAICPSLTIGTHFLWHLLNGLVLYLLIKALMDYGVRTAK
jgi:hypothetical protein